MVLELLNTDLITTAIALFTFDEIEDTFLEPVKYADICVVTQSSF